LSPPSAKPDRQKPITHMRYGLCYNRTVILIEPEKFRTKIKDFVPKNDLKFTSIASTPSNEIQLAARPDRPKKLCRLVEPYEVICTTCALSSYKITKRENIQQKELSFTYVRFQPM
jgi:hypothetical protein